MKNNTNNIARELNGYRLIYLPAHPKAMNNANWVGYVYEHTVVAESILGREIKDNEVVHHLDGNRKNNRYPNLLVLEKSQHGKLHVWINSGAPGCESLCEKGMNSLKAAFDTPQFCKICGRTLQLKQKTYCSPECFHLDHRKVLRPSKSQLIEDLTNLSVVKVAKKYGVSDNAIRKWMKSLGIKKSTMSQAGGTPSEGAETTGEVKSS